MIPSPQMESRSQSAAQISAIVVVNIIWWMIMLAAIGLGAKYLGLCTIQPNIPIFLIVLGATNILGLSLAYTSCICEEGFVAILISAFLKLLHLFNFGWFIAGTAWIYPIYPPNYTPGPTLYCHKTVYQFAFVVTTLMWVLATLMFVCGCCAALLTCCTTITAGSRFIPNRNSFYGATTDFQEPTAGDV